MVCSRLLREEGPRKRPAGGIERVRETIGFSQELRIATWNSGGLSHITMRSCKELGYDKPDSSENTSEL